MDMDLRPPQRPARPAPQAPLIVPEQPTAEDPFKPDTPQPPAQAPAPSQKKKKSHKGLKRFFLILLVLALLGGVGYGTFYWQHQHVDRLIIQRTELTKQIGDQTVQITALTTENTKLTKATASKNIFKVPELGVQLTVPESLQDMTYSIRNGKNDDGTPFIAADLSTKALTTGDKNCAPTATPALGGLFRTDGNATATVKPLKQFTGFYVVHNFGQATCSTTKVVQDILATDKAALTAALATIELKK